MSTQGSYSSSFEETSPVGEKKGKKFDSFENSVSDIIINRTLFTVNDKYVHSVLLESELSNYTHGSRSSKSSELLLNGEVILHTEICTTRFQNEKLFEVHVYATDDKHPSCCGCQK